MKNDKAKFKTKVKLRENLSMSRNKNLNEGIALWASFYRENPHRFIMDYLGFNLHIFQQILIYAMDKSNLFVFIASRGLGKSWLTAVYCCCRCVLYPGTKVVIASKTKSQAQGIIVEKINDLLYGQSVALRKEIKEIGKNKNNCYVEFWNGSTIKVVASNDNARYIRSHVLISDEYLLMDEQVVEKVLIPTLTGTRQPGYLEIDEYKHLVEENKQIYLSSAGYKFHWGYKKFQHAFKKMLKGEESFACSIPFTCSLEHGLVTHKMIKDEMEKEGTTNASFLMEYCGVFYGENSNAYFKLEHINQCRMKSVKAFYPPTNLEYLEYKNGKKKKWNMPKMNGEKRIIGVDAATAAGNQNDNSVYTLMRLLPDGDKYRREVVYIESHNGVYSEKQAIRIKQLYYDFNADFIIMDTAGMSSVWSDVQKSQYDMERDETYERFTCFNDDNTVDKEMARGALKVVYSLKPSVEPNHKMAQSLQDKFKTKTIRLLMNDIDAKFDMIENSNFAEMSSDEQARLLAPYVQTTAMMNELINLEYTIIQGNKIKIQEKGANRKDRYSSIAYSNLLADMIEQDEYKKKKRGNSKMKPLW